MASTASELAGATSNDIASARTALVAFLQERWPALTIRGGPLADLVLGPAADALAAVDVRAAAAIASLDPETALANGGYDPAVLTTALAGRGVTRGAASAATGALVLRFNTSVTRSIASGFRFQTADGVIFQTTSSIRFLVPGTATVLSTDVALVAEPGGTTFVGQVPVTAQIAAAAGNRSAGTAFTAVDTFDASLVAVWAATDLTGGTNSESDAALLARLPAATAPRTAASLNGAEGVAQAAVPSISAFSPVKFGDAAMMRGRSVLSTQTPGRFDLWYRIAQSPARLRIRVTATYQGLSGSFGIWQFALTRDQAPGRCLVEKALQTNQAITAAGYTPTSITPGFDLSGYSDPPDIRSIADAALSRFATAIVVFVDPDTATAGLTIGASTRSYDVSCRVIDGIDTGQDAVDTADNRVAGGDCLVRSAVPGLVAVTAVATLAAGVTATAAQVATAVAAAINSLGIDSQLSASQVGALAASRLPQGTSLLLSNWSATIYPNDGDLPITATVGGDGLSVADDLARNISAATVAYYCDPESVTASIS